MAPPLPPSSPHPGQAPPTSTPRLLPLRTNPCYSLYLLSLSPCPHTPQIIPRAHHIHWEAGSPITHLPLLRAVSLPESLRADAMFHWSAPTSMHNTLGTFVKRQRFLAPSYNYHFLKMLPHSKRIKRAHLTLFAELPNHMREEISLLSLRMINLPQ